MIAKNDVVAFQNLIKFYIYKIVGISFLVNAF